MAATWRILNTGKNSAYINMALDEVLLHAFNKENTSPVLRVYEWIKPAITIGYAQRPEHLIDIDRCTADGIELTRRITGGRALYHSCEIGYAIIGSIDDAVFGGSIKDTYRIINRVIEVAFHKVGIHVEVGTSPLLKTVPAYYRRSAPCFASHTAFELTLNGTKITGGAQRRFRNVFLQQGSIQLGPGAERIAEYLLDNKAKTLFRNILTSSEDVCNDINVSPACFTNAVTASFAEAVQQHTLVGSLTDEERQAANELSEARYGAKGWLHGDGSIDI